jgi:hypothetical protein
MAILVHMSNTQDKGRCPLRDDEEVKKLINFIMFKPKEEAYSIN